MTACKPKGGGGMGGGGNGGGGGGNGRPLGQGKCGSCNVGALGAPGLDGGGFDIPQTDGLTGFGGPLPGAHFTGPTPIVPDGSALGTGVVPVVPRVEPYSRNLASSGLPQGDSADMNAVNNAASAALAQGRPVAEEGAAQGHTHTTNENAAPTDAGTALQTN